jgi:hypothetical protein
LSPKWHILSEQPRVGPALLTWCHVVSRTSRGGLVSYSSAPQPGQSTPIEVKESPTGHAYHFFFFSYLVLKGDAQKTSAITSKIKQLKTSPNFLSSIMIHHHPHSVIGCLTYFVAISLIFGRICLFLFCSLTCITAMDPPSTSESGQTPRIVIGTHRTHGLQRLPLKQAK